MRHARLLCGLIVSLLGISVVAGIPVLAASSTPYTESFHADVAGGSALWWVTLGGVNGTSRLSGLESISSVSWYNVSAIKSTNWVSDFQVFGKNGYNVIPFPFVPSEGVFLTVGAGSFGDASAAAAAVDSYLLTALKSYSNGSGVYTFFSSFSFSTIVPKTLLKLDPTRMGGFAKLFPSSTFVGLQSPFIVFSGQRSAQGFTHALSLGSITNKALGTFNRPSILGYFGTTNTSITMSKLSSSSTVGLLFLDGEVRSNDSSAVVTNGPGFTGSYSRSFAPGSKLRSINASVIQVPPTLVAQRVVDTAAVSNGQNIAVFISLTDLSNITSMTNITFNDNWWMGNGFKFVSGNYSLSNLKLSPGNKVVISYTLQCNSTGSSSPMIPRGSVAYSYTVNSNKYTSKTQMNPIQLSIGGSGGPILYAVATPISGPFLVTGLNRTVRITVKNVGTQGATSVLVDGKQVDAILSGGSTKVDIMESAPSLTSANLTTSFPVTYQGAGGASLNSSTNVVQLFFSHNTMNIGYPTVSLGPRVVPFTKGSGVNLTLVFTTTDQGYANATGLSASISLPTGLGCGSVSGQGITCASGVVSLSYPKVALSSTAKAYMRYNLTNPANYIIPPFSFSWRGGGIQMNATAGGSPVPSGFVMKKTYSQTLLFGTMSTSGTVTSENFGPHNVYNLTVGTYGEAFGTTAGTAPQSNTTASLVPGHSLGFGYAVTVGSAAGSYNTSAVYSTFFFGGRTFSEANDGPTVSVYGFPSASIKTTPSIPEEGKSFNITVTIRNTSPVTISSVTFTLPIPSGVTLSEPVNAVASSGTLTVNLDSLPAHQSSTATVKATASSGTSIPYSGSKMTFVFAGTTIPVTGFTGGVAIGENVTTRYLIPTAVVLLVLLGVAFFVRMKANPSAPAAQQ